ncbi:MAG: hypothetical protein MJ245_02095 [Clostridia bacterium]|nr:hypothetical protein [Clostridia bacterium]
MIIVEDELHLTELQENDNVKTTEYDNNEIEIENEIENGIEVSDDEEIEKPKKLILTEEDEIDEIFGEDFDFGNEEDLENDEEKISREKNAKFAGALVNTTFYLILLVGIVGFLYGFFTHQIYTTNDGKAFLNKIDFGSYEGNLINDCNATSYFLNKVDDYISYIPNSMLKELEERGYVIHVVDDVTQTTGIDASYTSSEFSGYEVSGLYSKTSQAIYVRYMWDEADCVVHEIGHFISIEFHLIDKDNGTYDAFDSIYQKDKANFKNHFDNGTYATCNITEYFAEAFQMYFTNTASLKKYCPSTYEYFDNLYNDFENGLYDDYIYDDGYNEHN